MTLLPKLTTLNILDNPLCKSITYIDLVLLLLKGLDSLDSKKIDIDSMKNLRTMVLQMDAQGIIRTKDSELIAMKSKLKNLMQANEKYIEDILNYKNKFESLESELEFKNLQYEHKVKEVGEKISRFL